MTLNLAKLPLTALRSFEAAGRHLSFTRAAEELFVSQAAISRQVRELEERVGLALFERQHRQVVLTPAGQHLLDRLSQQFQAMAAALSSLQDIRQRQPVMISVEPGFAYCCLLPRLAAFQALYPDVTVTIDSSHVLTDFRNGTELAIRASVSRSQWPGVESRKLVDSPLTPVIAPGLFETPEQLLQAMRQGEVTFIHDESRDDWRLWLEFEGLDPDLANGGPSFTDTALVVQAVLRGQGVALPGLAVVADDLAAGRLVQPFSRVAGSCAYYLVAPDFAALRPEARHFVEWLPEAIRNGNSA